MTQHSLFPETHVHAPPEQGSAPSGAPHAGVPEPLDVSDCPLDGVRLIEASAGTGKTWNICGLYLRLLLERGLAVREILVVTFTNAATAELRERIRQRLVDTLAHVEDLVRTEDDPFVPRLLAALRTRGVDEAVLADRLRLALASFDEASIFTIHGFCQRALADTPFTARVPLQVELVQDDRELLLEVVQDFWRRRVAVESLPAPLAAHLVSCGDAPQGWAGLLKRHLAKPLATVRWPRDLGAAAVDGGAVQAAHAAARAAWPGSRETVLTALQAAAPALNARTYKPETVAQAIQAWDRLLACPDPLAALDEDPPGLELLTTAKLQACTKVKHRTPEHPFFELAQALHDARDAMRRQLALARLALLREMIETCAARLRELKQRRHVVAFDDMLFNLYQRLDEPGGGALAAALRARFPAALIDEFQDTDPLQFAIFRRIYVETEEGARSRSATLPPLFLVGDPKQAIYRFRNADLHTYLAAREQARAQYTLDANQRSSPQLIEALNALFCANERLFMLEGLRYHRVGVGDKPRPRLVDTSAPRAALQLWWLPSDEESGQPLEHRAAERLALQATAAEIARLLAAARRGEVRVGERPLGAGDIAVLVRSHAEGSRMRQALAALGVGSVELSQASVFASREAEELDLLLGAMLEPGREPRLKAALATSLMGWDAAGIDALSQDEETLLVQVQRFEDYRRLWLHRGVGPMLRDWLAREGVAGRLLRHPDGERRMTNLLHLIECLQQASPQHPAPDALLHWLQTQRQDPRPDEATQLRLESDQHLVQIVTIHRSKGLEYGIVFCPFLWKGRPSSGATASDGVEYHEDGATVIDYRKGLDPAFDEDRVKASQRLEESAEFLRLLYVALTRAVHRCVLVAGCYAVRTGQGVSTAESSRSLLNWVVAGQGMSPDEWLTGRREIDSIRSAWSAWASRAAPHVGFDILPRLAANPLAREAIPPSSIAALSPPPQPPAAWWIGSYSALVHGASREEAAQDRDLRTNTATEPGGTTAALDEDDPLRFPRGAAAGECVHTVFERVDFADEATWPSAIDAALRRLRGAERGATAESDAIRARMLHRMLRDVLATPLPLPGSPALRLAELRPSCRVHEMEFYLPAPDLDPLVLQRRVQAAGYALPHLTSHRLRGYLRGFIDMVFEHDGRYHVLDWKSNHLGDGPQSYLRPGLTQAMAREGYHLQALLYLVALHRHLASRLPGYVPARHLGGAVYLFVRGVRPGWTESDGHPTGVYVDRPDPALIESLSRLLAGQGGDA
ncbi:MAG TPA: exodeoxyribonuclease V subunit beta [Burkholderiaceae bacterium]|nr:exodeoxyribonuclease V subunit beta [Burkholderiaceae bacterium]